MFAQLFGAAKRAISRTPSYQGRSSEAREEVPEVPTSDPAPTDTADSEDAADTLTMVTTRRGTETPGTAATPASSAKKTVGKRELDALDTPTQVKRQRKTTVELTRNLRSTPRKGGDAPGTESTQDSADEAVDDTADATPRPDKASPLAIRRRSSPRVVVEPSSPDKEDAPTQDGFHTPEPASSEAAFVTPFTSKKALEGSPTPKAAQSATPAAAKKARGRPKKTQKDDVPEEMPSSTQESSAASPAAAAAAPKAHVRFGSEEPTMNAKGHTRYEAPAPAPAPTPAAVEDEDSGSDSDEAPEMVSTSAAASKAAAAHADTSRALAAQSEKERKKREAREQRIAEEQAAKRERDALKAQKAAARAKKAARLSSVAELDEDATPMDIDRTSLPSLLPDSLLANLGDVRPPTPPPEARGRTEEELRREKLNRHIKFLEQSSKAPKDKRVGKHHVAVLGQQKRALPPMVSKNTKGVREAWLKGRQGQQTKGKPRIGKTHRAKFGGGGFLRGDD
ncbi:hypothetical protein E8E12_006872 [Didymella heteroderae]|uniref:Uncharacterized protein n=1 Tax=Didymella heteroderae TaxID=1769908 RepID=A0A9P4WPC7_9PLEO|nr:hypothetical protein E8E12_006872 [Didymella heteroderae]